MAEIRAISIGDTVEVRSPSAGPWTGEVVSWVSETGETERARVRCLKPPANVGPSTIEAGQTIVVPIATLLPLGRDVVDPFAGARIIGPDQVTQTTNELAARAARRYTDGFAGQGAPAPPDPVEIVAWIMSDHRTAYNDPGPAGVCDDDRIAARRVLAALVAGPWHLVRGEVLHVTSLVTGEEHDEIRVDETWRS